MNKIICGKPRPENYLFCNWPEGLYCTKQPQHTGEHSNADRVDGVEYAWRESDYDVD